MQLHNILRIPNLEKPSKVTVELGMGDGRLLEKLAKLDINYPSCIYIGIELDKQHYEDAKRRINLDNVKLLNDSFENIIPTFPNESLDLVITVLPDPDFIDKHKQKNWQPFYKSVHSKLKNTGSFQLVTEIIDELLQSVPDEVYNKWVEWLSITFQSIGYHLLSKEEGAPENYSTKCLDQFRGDPKRIRMVTLNFKKS